MSTLAYEIPADILKQAKDPATGRIHSTQLEACWKGHGALLTVVGPKGQTYVLSFVRSSAAMWFGWAHEDKDCLLEMVASIAGDPEEEVARLAKKLGCERTALLVTHTTSPQRHTKNLGI